MEIGLASLLQFNAVLVVVLVALRARHHPGLDGITREIKGRQLRLDCHSMDIVGLIVPLVKIDLSPRLGIVVTCHSWAWTLVPPSQLDGDLC